MFCLLSFAGLHFGRWWSLLGIFGHQEQPGKNQRSCQNIPRWRQGK
jgi:hypothetical protein